MKKLVALSAGTMLLASLLTVASAFAQTDSPSPSPSDTPTTSPSATSTPRTAPNTGLGGW